MKHILGHYSSQTAKAVPFEIDTEFHGWFSGRSGVGKTSAMKRILIEEIRDGNGITVEDPHGDLILELLDHIPVERTNDVVFFNPAGPSPIGIKILTGELAVDALTSAVKTQWPEGWGPRTEEYIVNAALAIMDGCRNPTMVHVHLFFSSRKFRERILAGSKNPIVRDFGRKLKALDKRLREEAMAAPSQKIAKFLTNPLLRGVFGQKRGAVFGEWMDSKKIVLVYLPKGEIGSDACSLIGKAVLNEIRRAALERQRIPPAARVPHLVMVDEVKNFDCRTLREIYAEARKYRISLWVAAQHFDQIEDVDEILGNCTTQIFMRMGGAGAKKVSEECGEEIPAHAVLTLPNHWFYGLTVKEEGGKLIPVGPFRVEGLPPTKWSGDENRKRDVVNWSRDNWGIPREQVEREIAELLEEEADDGNVRQRSASTHRVPKRKAAGLKRSPRGKGADRREDPGGAVLGEADAGTEQGEEARPAEEGGLAENAQHA